MRSLRRGGWSAVGLSVLAALALMPLWAQTTANPPGHVSASEIPLNQLISPEQLHHMMETVPRQDLSILQVGSRVLFNEAHIAGAEYAGPASQPEGLTLLRSRVAQLPRSQAIVLYCGCCPWNRCPNVAPAWRTLHQMGFTHLRVLYIANNFGTDWIAKGYATVQPK